MGKKKTPFNRTYRFNLKMTFDDAKSYPDFNWLDLVAKEEEDRLVSKRKELQDQKQLNPFASDDEDQLQALAKKFEEKYGGATEKIKKKKKARKLDDYADLGYGYDSDDPFIDNSEVHDEIVPENLTTAHGGFYVNSGPLEFKARESADEDSDVEAVLAESEKANKKRKYKKQDTNLINKGSSSATAGKSQILNGGKKTDINICSEQSPPSLKTESTSTMNGMQIVHAVHKKPRARKEGAKPLGRPKKRNPDGTLVHPPKPKKNKMIEQQPQHPLQPQQLSPPSCSPFDEAAAEVV